MSFVAKLVKSGSIPIHFVTCKDNVERDCFYFIMSSYEKMKMLSCVKEGTFDLNDYGTIIARGFGKEASTEIKQRLKEKYGVENL